MSFTLGLHPLTRLIFNLNADVLRIGHILHFFSKFLHKKCSNLQMVMQQLIRKLIQLLRKPMQPTIAVPHATSCCIPPPHKLLIFKDFSESLSYIYIKAKLISKIFSLIQKNDKRFNFYTKQPPISPVGRNGGINGATRLDAPHGAGGVPPPCPALLARYAGCDARPVDPLGGLQPPALRAVPPASLHKEGGVKVFYPTGASPRSGRVRPGGQRCAGSVCATLEPPTSGRGLSTPLRCGQQSCAHAGAGVPLTHSLTTTSLCPRSGHLSRREAAAV